MKIEDSGGLEAAQHLQKVQKTGPAFNLFQAYGAQAAPGADSASVSAEAQELDHFSAKIRDLPDIRADRVAEVQAKWAAGNHEVPVDDLAEAMFRLNALDHESE